MALAAKDAAKQVPEFEIYEKLVHSIYAYFSRSVERMARLKMIEENIGDPQLMVLNIINTRWLSLSKCGSKLTSDLRLSNWCFA